MKKYKFNIVNIIIKIVIIILGITLFILPNINPSKAAWVSSDINGINENAYPGYKSLIQTLQKQYENWDIKLYYTGINWEDAISGEYTGHKGNPTSLSYYTYKGEWICPICGDQTYDVSHEWYCASRKAIAYMMDPRNSLTEDWIFQFQNLGSSSGERSEVEKMVQGTFLSNSSCVTAIMEAAQTYNISPFHLVSRITHEQSNSGVGTMNGYIYTPENGVPVKVYNLYNIKVSGNDAEEGFLAGAKFAYDNGWFSQEESIKGGAKFLREAYIDKGQNTLYFQKYNVVDMENLYKHQYMQNIRAANDEGNKIYKAYKATGILSSHFEFVIPIYENMPTNPSSRPLNSSPDYRGDIATEIKQLELKKNDEKTYIQGEIIVTEWIDGITWSIPKTTPKIRVKEVNGEKSYEMWVINIEENRYYFDGYIDGIDIEKEYEIEVESGSKENTSPYKKAKGYYNGSKTVGQYIRHELKIVDNVLRFQPTNYYGDIATQILKTSLETNEQGRPYIAGEILITEWIGTLWTIPDVTPEITMISTDNSSEQQFWVNNIESNRYYFDGYIDGLDMTKEYVIQIKLKNTYNISRNQQTNAIYKNDMILGNYDNKEIIIEGSKIIFDLGTYQGDIANEITNLELRQNEQGKTYLKGEIIVTEWIDGVTWSIPKETPKMRIKEINGEESYEFWVLNIGENKYYFDGYIEGIDIQKEYEIEVESGKSNNISKYRKVRGVYNKNKELGIYKEAKVKVEESKIVFNLETYQGDIANEITNLELKQNEQGKTYLQGEIVVTEWINGVTWSIPKETPKIRMKEINGEESYEFWVINIGGNRYYFDGYIEGINVQNEYEIEVESGSRKNISKYRKTKGIYNKERELGIYKDNKVKIESNIIRFINISKEIMTIESNTEILQDEKDTNIETFSVINEEEIIVEEQIEGVKQEEIIEEAIIENTEQIEQ